LDRPIPRACIGLSEQDSLIVETARRMNGSKHNCLLAAAVTIPTAASIVGWWALPLLGGDTWPVRIGLMGGILALAGGSVALVLYRNRHHRRSVERHVDALCRLDPRNFRGVSSDGEVPPLPPGNPWRSLADRVRDTLIGYCGRLQDMEHARAALEIRCRRATSQCEQIRAILAGLSEPILVIDDFDELLLANPAAEQLFRFDAEKAEQRAVNQLVRCQKLVDLLTATSHRKSAGNRCDEVEVVDGDGQPHWFRVYASKLMAAGGDADSEGASCYGAVAVLRDIGHQKELQKRNAEFVSSVSHEMKTPLAGIKAYVELLVDGDAEDEETREEFLQVVNSQADRLQRLVDNLLNLARIEAGVVNVNKQNRSLNELLEEAVHVVQPAAEAKGIELVTELSPLYLGVLADRDMLLQSAINLLSNAIKYTPEEGRVTLRSRLADHDAVFEVQDTGVGLSEEDCRRIFEKFYRVKKDKGMAAGTGLGLPLAKHIVEDVHGGRLSVESTLGVGSLFCVSLPKAGQMT
jgi:two-component system phosphate regulon sensor histidine kinase PhoR